MSIDRYLGFIVFLLLLNFASSSFISEAIFESHRSTGRSLLQTQKNCPINFENQNYTIITSQCKGPKYSADTCCKAFKEFACPFADELNDMSNNCASTMFSYINLYGKYPPGIFANECKEGKHGLECDDSQAHAVSKNSKSSGHRANDMTAMVVILATSFFSLFCLLWRSRCWLHCSSYILFILSDNLPENTRPLLWFKRLDLLVSLPICAREVLFDWDSCLDKYMA